MREWGTGVVRSCISSRFDVKRLKRSLNQRRLGMLSSADLVRSHTAPTLKVHNAIKVKITRYKKKEIQSPACSSIGVGITTSILRLDDG